MCKMNQFNLVCLNCWREREREETWSCGVWSGAVERGQLEVHGPGDATDWMTSSYSRGMDCLGAKQEM